MMIREDDGYEIVRDCECMQFRMDKRLVERSGLALRLENYQLDKFETSEQWQKRMKEAAEQFIEDYKGKWFVTLGCSGAGKTHLNCSIVSELMRKGNPAKYISWRDLTIKLKPLMNTDEYIREIYEYKNSKVLYIDDLFKNGHFRTPSTADLDIAMEILNFRYNNREKYTTLISSEHLIDSIMAFDEALGSRIFEMCGDKYLLQIDKDSSKNYRLKNY